jgi:hypothetical protein
MRDVASVFDGLDPFMQALLVLSFVALGIAVGIARLDR